jgi:hypothetical protein
MRRVNARPTMFTVIDAVLSKPLPFAEPDCIVSFTSVAFAARAIDALGETIAYHAGVGRNDHWHIVTHMGAASACGKDAARTSREHDAQSANLRAGHSGADEPERRRARLG